MNAWLVALGPHLLVAPILLPMFTAAVLLLLDERQAALKAWLSVTSALLGLLASSALALRVARFGIEAYLPSNWPPPFGIVLVADRLSVLMLVLVGVLATAALLFASARWDRAGVHFHSLAQLQVMGLCGAFLTGDLFNLFVFFEILLAASFGLLLHGSGGPRVRAGLRYVAVNLAASSLFLIGAATLYGVTGTLTLADLAERARDVSAADHWLIDVGGAVLGLAFLVKAAAFPLNFWLVPAYSTATAPVAAIFAVLTKVGLYALLRVWTLLSAEGSAPFAGNGWLLTAGVVSACLGALGMLGAQRLAVLASFGVVVSSGTLLAVMGLGQWEATGGALFYLLGSTLAFSALFLLTDVIERWRNQGATRADDAPFLSASFAEEAELNLDDEGEWVVGRPFAASTALLGLAFITCALVVVGLPPMPGFVGKVAMISAALNLAPSVSPAAWAVVVVLLGTGLVSLFAMLNAGLRYFWLPRSRPGARVRLSEGVPLGLLLGCTLALTIGAGPLLDFTREAARALYSPRAYVDAVLGAKVKGGPP
jgi:multicomponent K+:H+ antiporter subunit D